MVCNDGDIALINVNVSDNPPATITFATTTSLGNPFPAAGGGRLLPGECVNYSGSYTPSGNLCGPFADTITATGTDTSDDPLFVSKTVSATNSATCAVCTNPGIDVIKECLDQVVQAGNSTRYRIRVQNTGDVPLQNVQLVDDSFTPGIPSDDVTINVPGTLAPGAFFPATGFITNLVTTTTAQCGGTGTITNTVVATGANVCNPAQTVTDTDRCSVRVVCQPRICVTKEVACLIATNLCGPFGESATGFKVVSSTSTNLPAFCYSITVSNCGEVCLTNNRVIDDQFGDLTTDFFANPSEVFCPGQIRSFTFSAELEFDQTNTVNASGRSVANGQIVSAIDTAEVHVLPASIDCTKLVSSPDDVDGNANDSHVQFPCGSGSHLVSYSVVVTNTGSADLTNIVITDPALSNFCSMPGPFSLAAGASIHLPLCGPLNFECGLDGGNTNNCANPMLKEAQGCTVLQLGGYKVDITGPPGGIDGDICIGPNGKLSITGEEFVTGDILLDMGATFSKSGSGTIGGTVIHTNLSAEINAAIAASHDAAALPCTQNYPSLKTARTISSTGPLNVICVGDVSLNGGAVLTLSGGPNEMFVINVTGKFALTGGSKIVVAGGLTPGHVLYNIIGTGGQVAFSGGGGGAGCCKASVDGTLIALERKIALSPGLVNGQLIGGRDISIVSGSSVRCPSGCPPTSFVNTLTVSAELSALQGGTNAFNACVHDLNGLPITVRHQCSATVECR
jgi:hypothetical protein